MSELPSVLIDPPCRRSATDDDGAGSERRRVVHHRTSVVLPAPKAVHRHGDAEPIEQEASYTLDRLPSLDFSELVRDVAYLARE